MYVLLCISNIFLFESLYQIYTYKQGKKIPNNFYFLKYKTVSMRVRMHCPGS